MAEGKGSLLDLRYSKKEQLAGDTYFGELYNGYDHEADREVLLVRLMPHLVSFIGNQQVQLRVKLFQDLALPMLQVHDVHQTSEGTFVVYEKITGAVPLLEYMALQPFSVALDVFLELCEAIATLHRHSMWHGGILPEYVWVLPTGEVRLMTMLTDSPLSYFNACGQANWLQLFAPETMKMSPFDARTDIYNLGVLFYYALTGQFPFEQSEGTLHPPSRYNEHIPPQLDRLILRMINRQPTRRFQWIGQIIDELIRMLGRQHENSNMERIIFGSQHLFSAAFTGRDQEVKKLSQFYERMIKTGRQTLLITGMQGVGRKRLIYEVYGQYMLEVSGLSSTVSRSSYAAVDDLAMKLLMMCFLVPKLEKLGLQYVQPLSRVLPKVAHEYSHLLVDHPLANQAAPDKREREALLYEFFTEVVEANNEPMVFELYDAHLLDSDSLKFFQKLLERETLPLGLIGVSEFDTPAMRQLFEGHLSLLPLPKEYLRKCVRSVFGDAQFLGDEFIQWLDYHASGSLDQVFQLINYLADTKQVYLQGYKWHMVPQTVSKLDIPESMESLILYRMDKLSPLAKQVCQVLSLFKGVFVPEAMAKVSGLPNLQEAMQVMHSLAEQGLLLKTRSRYQFPTNNVKMHIYQSIPEADRPALHRQMASGLLEAGAQEITEIAFHLEQGFEWERAICLNILSARRNFVRDLYNDAEEQIKKAIELYRHLHDRQSPTALHTFWARCLKNAGRLEEASSVFAELYERTGSIADLVQLTLLYINMGHYQKVGEYMRYIREQLELGRLTMKQRLYLMIVVAMYELEVKGRFDFILAAEEYHLTHGQDLREQLQMRDYVNWLYNLQVLLTYVPDVTWEHRARYLHEAATLAEHHNLRHNLIGIYNGMAIGFQETDPLRAKDYYLQSARLAAELGDKSKEAIAYINIVDIYRLLGDMYHSRRYIEKARQTRSAVNKEEDTYLLQNEIEYFLFIEDYEKAGRVIDVLARTAKRTHQQKMREFAFLYRFRYCVELGQKRRCDRMWSIVDRICKNRKFSYELQFLRGKYFLLLERNKDVVADFKTLVEETAHVPAEMRIRRYLMLTQAYMNDGCFLDALDMALTTQKLIHNTGHVGFLAQAHFYLGRLYQLTYQFVHANLNYKRALMWYRKLNQQDKMVEIERFMNQTNLKLLGPVENIVDHMKQGLQTIDERAVAVVEEDSVRLRDWAQNVVNERQDMINTLTDNEILLDAIRRVSSSILVKTVCENVAAVVFENVLFDNIYLHIYINDTRDELIQLNEQLQTVPGTNHEVQELIETVRKAESAVEKGGTTSYYYALPVLSHDQTVIAVFVLEKLSVQAGFSKRDKRFLGSFAQLVSSNVENAIMYEVMITDNLTGLYQRNYFMKRLSEEFTKVIRYGIDLSFLMIDLDNFSLVNNRYGHNEGDRVLRIVSQTLLKSVRNVDIVGRFGGEEMIVILPNTNGSSACIVAERILNNLRNISVEDNRYRITASIGVSSYDLDQPTDMIDLIEKADQAETYAKRTGKNRVVCYWEMVDQKESPEA